MSSTTSHQCLESPYIPRGLLLQWHITQGCNLRCAHCYQETRRGQELGFPDLLKILDGFKDLLEQWRRQAPRRPLRAHITVTGGEPFVRQDFLDLLEVFRANRKHFSFAILTNGSSIDAAMARRLRKLDPTFVQVSFEGTQATHDNLRGKGNFEQTVSSVRHLVRARVRTFISFTANRLNYRDFAGVARLGRRLRVSRVWADRLIPMGNGEALKEQVLTPGETREFLLIMHRARIEAAQRWSGRTEVAMHRALQFLVAGEAPYHCTAGDTLLTVQPNGDLYPCRRMPIRIGNVVETPLTRMYYNSELLCALRDRSRISDGCRGCFHARLCRGGLKCLAFAMSGDPFTADPGCWIKPPRHVNRND